MFVLHDLFGVPFEDIAPIVGRSPVAARTLARRARRRVQASTCAAGPEFDLLDVAVAADEPPYASFVDGCAAEECHFRLGQGFVGHPVSGPPLVGTEEE